MAGDGKTGGSDAGDDNDGPASESGAPSSRGQRTLLAAGIGEHTAGAHNALQSNGNTSRSALEHEGRRFTAASRHARQSRKKARRGGVSPARAVTTEESDLRTQQESTAGRTVSVATARSAERWQGPAGETPGPTVHEGTHAASQQDSAAREREFPDAGEPPVPADALGDRAEARGRQRRVRRKPATNSAATRLLVSVVEAAWDEEVAAFMARGFRTPPLPYRPTDYAECFELTAEQRRAIPKEQIRRLNSKPTKCVARALAVCPLLDEWRPRMVFLPVKLWLIDLVPTLARALSHADARLAMALEVSNPDLNAPGETRALTRRELMQRMLQVALVERARLHSEVRNWITLGRLPTGALSNLKGGRGYSNVALDVLSLIELRRAALTSGAASSISEEDVRRCALLAYGLIETSARTPNGIDAVRAAALEERSRAFTLLWLAYNEAGRALTFIFWNYGKQRVVLPALV